jgi:hypothetical protein
MHKEVWHHRRKMRIRTTPVKSSFIFRPASLSLILQLYAAGLRELIPLYLRKQGNWPTMEKTILFVGLILTLLSLLPCVTLFQRTICTK